MFDIDRKWTKTARPKYKKKNCATKRMMAAMAFAKISDSTLIGKM